MSTKVPHGTLEKLWRDPANWRYGCLYHCKEDPRTIVPKRMSWTGWTINFAHRSSVIQLLVGMLLAVAPLLLLQNHASPWLIWTWLAILIIVSVVIGLVKGSPAPYEEP